MENKDKLLSIIVPCYNEEQTVENFYKTACSVLEKTGYGIEIIFVNDGSADKTQDILNKLADSDKRVKVINFSRNFGQQAAILCGFEHAKGDAVIEADCDLQDPIDVVLQMLEKWEQGYEVVHGRRIKRQGESLFKKATAAIYYKLLNKITKVPVPRNTGDFKLYDRKAINAVISMPERDKYLRGLASWVGFKQTFVDFERKERIAGETKYTLKKMINLAKSGIISNSDAPLYLSVILGVVCTILCLACFITFIVLTCCDVKLPLTAWLFPSVAIMFSINYLFNGISNVYLARVYDEVKNRPDYIIDTTRNVD
ncbi:MAG: glycosyltransferase family 2 protein [Clostridia bacterium]|nr:glycosyltransferase family 2 protein [Clostridia bacterium]